MSKGHRTRLGTSAWSNTVALLVNLGVAFLLTPYLIASLGDDRYGAWVLVITVVGYTGVLNLGVGPAVTRFVAERLGRNDTEGARQVVRASLSILLVSATTVAMAGFFGAAEISRFLKAPAAMRQEFEQLIRIAAFSAGVVLLSQLPSSVLKAYEKFPLLNVITAILGVVRGIGIWIILYFGGGLIDLVYLTLAFVSSTLIANVVAARATCPAFTFQPFGANRRTYFTLLGFGLSITIIAVAGIFRFQLGNLIAAKYLAFDQVAVFGVAATIAGYYLTFITVPTSVLLPRFSSHVGSGNTQELERLFLLSSKFNTVLASAMGLVIILCSKAFLTLWLRRGFTPDQIELCSLVLQIITAAYIVELSQAGSMNLIYGMRRQKFLTAVNVAEGVAIFILSIFLVQRIGLIGIAVGLALPMAISKLTTQPWYAARMLKVSLPRYYWQCLLLPWLCCAAVLGIGLAMLQWVDINSWPRLILLAAGALAVFALCGWFLTFSASERIVFGSVLSVKPIIARVTGRLRKT